jgi:hypothetical protein
MWLWGRAGEEAEEGPQVKMPAYDINLPDCLLLTPTLSSLSTTQRREEQEREREEAAARGRDGSPQPEEEGPQVMMLAYYILKSLSPILFLPSSPSHSLSPNPEAQGAREEAAPAHPHRTMWRGARRTRSKAAWWAREAWALVRRSRTPVTVPVNTVD